MFLQIVSPGSHEEKINICWHNLSISDEVMCLEMFISAALSWVKLNPELNYSHLEQQLREKNLNTHLIAKNFIENGDVVLKYGDTENKCEYECIFSCRPKEVAIRELLEYSESYDINLNKLAKAGSICCKNKNINNNDFRMLGAKEKTILEMIIDCEKKLVLRNSHY